MRRFGILFALAALTSSCQGYTPAVADFSVTATKQSCPQPAHFLEISISPDREDFQVGDEFIISVDAEDRYTGLSIYLDQDGVDDGLSSAVPTDQDWGLLQTQYQPGQKSFRFRAIKPGTTAISAAVYAEVSAYDVECISFLSFQNVLSIKIPITIHTAVISPTTTASAVAVLPDGQYFCQGHEGGLIASIGSVTFSTDGGFLDEAFYGPSIPGNNGTWSFDPDSGRLIFSDNLDFAFGVFDGAQDTVTLDLRAGVTRAHADGGRIYCFGH